MVIEKMSLVRNLTLHIPVILIHFNMANIQGHVIVILCLMLASIYLMNTLIKLILVLPYVF